MDSCRKKQCRQEKGLPSAGLNQTMQKKTMAVEISAPLNVKSTTIKYNTDWSTKNNYFFFRYRSAECALWSRRLGIKGRKVGGSGQMSIKAKHLIHLPTDRCNRYNRSKSRNRQKQIETDRCNRYNRSKSQNKNTILDGLGSQNHNTIFRFMLPEVSEDREIIFLYCYFSCLFTADKLDIRQQSPPPIKDSRCWSSWSIILGWG